MCTEDGRLRPLLSVSAEDGPPTVSVVKTSPLSVSVIVHDCWDSAFRAETSRLMPPSWIVGRMVTTTAGETPTGHSARLRGPASMSRPSRLSVTVIMVSPPTRANRHWSVDADRRSRNICTCSCAYSASLKGVDSHGMVIGGPFSHGRISLVTRSSNSGWSPSRKSTRCSLVAGRTVETGFVGPAARLGSRCTVLLCTTSQPGA